VAGAALADTPAPNWAGGFVGLNAGYGWGRSSVTLDATLSGVPTPWFVALDSTDIPESYRINSGGFIGGLQLGRNFQNDRTVYGFEADISYSGIGGDISRSGSMTGGSPPVTSDYFLRLERELQWLATFRARLGVAQDVLHNYATGGLAVGRIANSMQLDFLNVGGTDYFGSRSSTRAGWTAGLGAERRINDKLSAKLEYLYYDLGKTQVTAIDIVQASNPFQNRAHFKNNGHIVRFGLNYRTD
jgi:outer membrane immunogenic protein